jgi:hypothetical protein
MRSYTIVLDTPPKWANAAAERIPRIRQRHVERVDLADAAMSQNRALDTPADLRLQPVNTLNRRCNPANSSSPIPNPGAIRGRACCK